MEEFPVLRGRLVAQFALGICALSPCPCIWQVSTKIEFLGDTFFRGCNTKFDSGYMFFEGFGIIYIFSTMR